MYLRKDKPQENKSQSTAKFAVQSKAGGINSFEFVDNRTQPAQLKSLTDSVSEYSGLQLKTTEGNNNAVVDEDSAIQRKRNIIEPASHRNNHEVVQRIYKKEIKKGEEKEYFEVIDLINSGAAGAIYSAKLLPDVYNELKKVEENEEIEGLPTTIDELIAVKHVDGNALGEDKIDRKEHIPLEATLPGILTKQHRDRVGNVFAKIAPDTFGVLVVKDPKREDVIKEFFIMMELATKGSIVKVTPKGFTKFDDGFNANAKAYFNNLNSALTTLEASDYTSGDIKGDNTLIAPAIGEKDIDVTTIGTEVETVTAVLADFGDYKKGAYRSRKNDLTSIMNIMFKETSVNKDFEEITAWSVSDKPWKKEPKEAE